MNPAVVIPVHNEADRIGEVLDQVDLVHDGHVLVVDDGSSDGTAETLRKHPWVEVRRHAVNLGYGRALMDGLRHVFRDGHRYVVVLDGDGQHLPERIPGVAKVLAEGWDIVSGSRYLPASPVLSEAPGARRAVNRLVTAELNAVAGWHLTDAFCGFKGYDLASVASLDVREEGYAMPLEFWARAHQAGLSITEVPVDRVYLDDERSFGGALDDDDFRLAHYRSVFRRAMAARVPA